MVNIENELKNIIVKAAKKSCDVTDINEDTNLVDNLGLDSLAMIELILEIEKVFNVQMDDEDMDINILTKYTSLKELIVRKINI